jgi:hypothetical protein
MDVCWVCIIAIPLLLMSIMVVTVIYLLNCLLFLVVCVGRRYFFLCIIVVDFGELCTVRTNQASQFRFCVDSYAPLVERTERRLHRTGVGLARKYE